MQPYFMPYIGYFQMIKAVDVFVFYDDVNYIKGGWINRNQIIINNKATYFTIPLKNSSSFKKINEIEILKDTKDYKKIIKSVEQAYRKAPYYLEIMPIMYEVFNYNIKTISELSIESIIRISKYLQLETKFKVASKDFFHTKDLDRCNRLIQIVKECKGKYYINAIGGNKLYSKDYFKNHDVELNFIQSLKVDYKQFNNEFIPWLSIIDVLMFNSPEEVNIMLDQYKLS